MRFCIAAVNVGSHQIVRLHHFWRRVQSTDVAQENNMSMNIEVHSHVVDLPAAGF